MTSTQTEAPYQPLPLLSTSPSFPLFSFLPTSTSPTSPIPAESSTSYLRAVHRQAQVSLNTAQAKANTAREECEEVEAELQMLRREREGFEMKRRGMASTSVTATPQIELINPSILTEDIDLAQIADLPPESDPTRPQMILLAKLQRELQDIKSREVTVQQLEKTLSVLKTEVTNLRHKAIIADGALGELGKVVERVSKVLEQTVISSGGKIEKIDKTQSPTPPAPTPAPAQMAGSALVPTTSNSAAPTFPAQVKVLLNDESGNEHEQPAQSARNSGNSTPARGSPAPEVGSQPAADMEGVETEVEQGGVEQGGADDGTPARGNTPAPEGTVEVEEMELVDETKGEDADAEGEAETETDVAVTAEEGTVGATASEELAAKGDEQMEEAGEGDVADEGVEGVEGKEGGDEMDVDH